MRLPFHYSPARWLLLTLAFLALSGAAWAFPATIDSDIEIRLYGTSTVGGGTWSTFGGEGWVHLALVQGSLVKYSGTFTDNLNSGTSYVAKADTTDATAPVLTVLTRFGKFVFTMDSSFGSASYNSASAKTKPANFAQTTGCYLYATTHGYATNTYSLSLDMVVGFPNAKALAYGMTLSLMEDNLRFIVPRDPLTHDVSSLSIPTAPNPTFTHITSPGYYGTIYSNGGASDGLFLTISYFGRYITLSGNLIENTSNFSGSAVVSGAKSAAEIGTFEATKQ